MKVLLQHSPQKELPFEEERIKDRPHWLVVSGQQRDQIPDVCLRHLQSFVFGQSPIVAEWWNHISQLVEGIVQAVHPPPFPSIGGQSPFFEDFATESRGRWTARRGGGCRWWHGSGQLVVWLAPLLLVPVPWTSALILAQGIRLKVVLLLLLGIQHVLQFQDRRRIVIHLQGATVGAIRLAVAGAELLLVHELLQLLEGVVAQELGNRWGFVGGVELLH